MRFPTICSVLFCSGMCDLQSLRSAWAYAQSDQSLCGSLEYSMGAKLLTEHNLEFLSLRGGCIDSSESAFVKMTHCWKSHVMAHIELFSKQSRRVMVAQKNVSIVPSHGGGSLEYAQHMFRLRLEN